MTTLNSTDRVISSIKKILKKDFSIQAPDVNKNLADLDFKKTVFISKINEFFDLSLNVAVIWEYPSIEKLAKHIAYLTGLETEDPIIKITPRGLKKQAPLAIIGMGCRFPGNVNNCEEFWELLASGSDPISEVPTSRWNIDEYYSEDYEEPFKMNTRFGGFLEDIDLFDATFFNISPKEAIQMDPQQRMFLEVSWQALENAGIPANQLATTSTGVFVGVSMHDYDRLMAKQEDSQKANDAYSNLGSAHSAVGGRLSYFLGLNGPTFAIDTACSSSLSALYQASLSLRAGDCDMAIAGGVNLILDPGPTISYSKAHMMASDGRCKTFDKRANGYVRSEGCGVIILKRLEDAIKDGDTIYAVVKSILANQDGASNGLTAPSMIAQASLLQNTLYCADLNSENIDLFETHGTGTFIGDTIEIDAINNVYSNSKRETPLYLGALKSHIGHCEAAAGIAGLIKLVLAMQHKKIPGNLHYTELNSNLDISKVPCEILTSLIPWESENVRRAALSSFGFTGTNVHAILEEAPLEPERDSSIVLPLVQLFVLSAKSVLSLKGLVSSYVEYLKTTEESIEDICYTAAVGRNHFGYRIALETKDKKHLCEQLQNMEIDKIEAVNVGETFSSRDIKTLRAGYLRGDACDWESYYAPFEGALRKVRLPSYVFDKQRYWIEEGGKEESMWGEKSHALLGARLPGYSKEIRFFNRLSVKGVGYLKEHQVFGDIILPAACFIESGLSGVLEGLGFNEIAVEEFQISSPLRLREGEEMEYQVSLTPEEGGGWRGEIYARGMSESEWERPVRFRVKESVAHAPEVKDMEALRSGLEAVDISGIYQRFHSLGLDYGASFQGIKSVYRGKGSLLIEIEGVENTSGDYVIHPTVLDSVFQSLMLLEESGESKTYLPAEMGHIISVKHVPSKVYAWLEVIEKSGERVVANLELYDENGVGVMGIEGFVARAADSKVFKQLLEKGAGIEEYVEVYDSYELPVATSSEKGDVIVYKSGKEERIFGVRTVNPTTSKDFTTCHVVYVYEEDFMSLVSVCKKIVESKPLSFTLVTRGAYGLSNEEKINPEHCQALGFYRSLREELSPLPCCCVDLQEISGAEKVIEAIARGVKVESEIIIRETMFVPRLVRVQDYYQRAEAIKVPGNNEYLVGEEGIESVRWGTRDVSALSAGEVKIRICDTGLNFRDVLKALKMYPGEAGDYGYECSGIIEEVGDDVEGLKVGDRVMAVGQGLLGSTATVDALRVVKIPTSLGLEDASGVPIVFLTAHYGLNKLAKLKAGMKVLIHAGAGGVGLAAIQLARLQGAEVYTTASEGKRDYLKSLGIKHVYDSRSMGFGEAILRDTEGAGVDVVLNSLTSEGFIASSLSCLKKGGTFIEIGKLNIYSAEQMARERGDVKYHIIALDERIEHKASEIQEELREIAQLFEEKKLSPLPKTVFEVREIKAALKTLQRGGHVGKVIIQLPEAFHYSKENTYLITGGTGGLGFELAKHLVEAGAQHVVLTSRNAPSEEVKSWMASQKSQGVSITHYAVDVSDREGVKKVFKGIASSGYPLKGIFHVAGILRDGLLSNLQEKDFSDVLSPKVEGADNLVFCSEGLPLDCFVFFSSITLVLGNAGQSNYTAANGYVEGLAKQLRAKGIPAMSIAWGPFAKVGMAVDLKNYHLSQGLIPLQSEISFNLMNSLLNQSYPNVMLANVNWEKAPRREDPYLKYLVNKDRYVSQWVEILKKMPQNKRKKFLNDKLKELIGEMLKISDTLKLDVNKGFFEMGLDSLMAMELKNKIETELGKKLKVRNTFIFDFPNISKLSDYFIDEVMVEYFSNNHDINDDFLDSFEDELNKL